MSRIAQMTTDLQTETQKVSGMGGSYADFVYRGEELFLNEVAKHIKKIAGGHAERVHVIRSGGRAPLLVYEGQDRSDTDLEFTVHLISTSSSDVLLSWFGTSALGGRFDSKRKFKWGQLTPATASAVFQEVFGR